MEFLLEINVEEMPSSHVRTARRGPEGKVRAGSSAAAKIPARDLRTFSTCRRLVVVADLAEGQEAREEVVTGPPKAAAFAADGSPTPAALGFARSQGVDVAQLEVIKTEKGEYVGFRKTETGKELRPRSWRGSSPRSSARSPFPK